MRHGSSTIVATILLAAATAAYAAPPPAPASDEKREFQLQDTHTAKEAHGATASKIKPTRTEAAMKLFVVDKDKGPVKGVVILVTGPDKTKYYTEPTDSEGYAEVLVPVGRRYDIAYLSLGRREIAATIPVADEPSQSVKLTLRYKREVPQQPFILAGVEFDTAKATIRPESFPRLDTVVEFMLHKTDSRVEISGHTDNVGNAKANKTLSDARAQACRNYIVSRGIDKDGWTPSASGPSAPSLPTTPTRAAKRTAASKRRSCSTGRQWRSADLAKSLSAGRVSRRRVRESIETTGGDGIMRRLPMLAGHTGGRLTQQVLPNALSCDTAKRKGRFNFLRPLRSARLGGRTPGRG